jgi:ABC-2 type transport system permease protein
MWSQITPRAAGLKRYIRIHVAFVENCLARETEFNIHFFTLVSADAFIILTWLALFSVIYSRVDAIGGWTREETMFFLGTFALVDCLNMIVFMHNTLRLPEYVRTGGLDTILTRPMDSQVYVMTRYLHFGHISEAVAGLPFWPTRGGPSGSQYRSCNWHSSF